ncbi:MAG TPA: type IV pilus modification protein PilV [Steroidobacteraceae bacterium]|nr:type IV pilus modification protein PilV [Steroidobacteraceae bacterium]
MRYATHRNFRGLRARARGFSLVEVMVALVVICVGLLGVAKMQALALSSTNIARQRSMAAFLAASLASAMNSNRLYWANATAVAASNPTPITINSATGTITPASLAGVANTACIGAANVVPTCPGTAGAQTLAAFDLTRWSATVSPLLPNAVTTITCQGATPPNSCIIQMTWTEQVSNGASGTNAVAFENPTYTLYVEP